MGKHTISQGLHALNLFGSNKLFRTNLFSPFAARQAAAAGAAASSVHRAPPFSHDSLISTRLFLTTFPLFFPSRKDFSFPLFSPGLIPATPGRGKKGVGEGGDRTAATYRRGRAVISPLPPPSPCRVTPRANSRRLFPCMLCASMEVI